MKFDRSSLLTIGAITVILLVMGSIAGYLFINRGDDRDSDASASLSVIGSSTYTDLQGEPVSLQQFAGSVRVVNSWASWTPFSRTELPNLEKLASEFSDQNVVVIAINRKESATRAQSYLKHIGDLSQIHMILDPSDAFYSAIGGFAMPETVFYDKRGAIVYHQRGNMSLTQMRSHTQAAIDHTK